MSAEAREHSERKSSRKFTAEETKAYEERVARRQREAELRKSAEFQPDLKKLHTTHSVHKDESPSAEVRTTGRKFTAEQTKAYEERVARRQREEELKKKAKIEAELKKAEYQARKREARAAGTFTAEETKAYEQRVARRKILEEDSRRRAKIGRELRTKQESQAIDQVMYIMGLPREEQQQEIMNLVIHYNDTEHLTYDTSQEYTDFFPKDRCRNCYSPDGI
jgi:hypothetical protein